jgi:predicted nucleic acid-binding Zn ribbon protein
MRILSDDAMIRIKNGAINSAIKNKQLKEQRRIDFFKACKKCGQNIGYDHRENQYCSRSCAASFNNKIPKRKLEGKCKNCKSICSISHIYCNVCFSNKHPINNQSHKVCMFCNNPNNKKTKFCSQKCYKNFEYEKYITQWKLGVITGLTNGVVSNTIKKYLREKYDNKCVECGWSKINSHTNKVPLFADHIDGNWQNNSEENLRLLCGCCDSLTATYGGANRGKGRAMNGGVSHRKIKI